MSIKIIRFEDQTPGGFNDGEILENRPIVLSHESDKMQPYSNIFYWAHAWSEKGSTIGEHPHKAFEIMSFVLKGSIEHYDSKNKKWIPLKAGDVQIIRAGSGIRHSEKLNPGAEMFQIWLDPDIEKTIGMPASYNDYSAHSFPVFSENGFSVKTYIGEGSPLEMVSEGVSIREISFDVGTHRIQLNEKKIASIYIIEGSISQSMFRINANDFIVAENEDKITFEAREPGKLFMIESPVRLPYETYVEKHMHSHSS